jgi:hypothetical protein
MAIRCFSIKEQGPAPRLPMSRPRMGILVVFWAGFAALGLGAMLDFELTPARPGAQRNEWPSRSLLVRDPRRPTLLMFVHPHCPCSRASLAELSNLATSCRDRMSIEVLFVKPAGCDDDWERTDLLTTAQRIPGGTVALDRNGTESIRFGATTSGETLLFDSGGGLLFRGGITPSRGHEGDNAGRATVEALVTRGSAVVSESPVYGCSLLNQCSLGEESRGQCNR